MSRIRTRQPENAIVLKTYEELEPYHRAFAEGHIGLLILVGDPGLEKSRLARQVLGGEVAWIDTRATAYGLYRELYEKRERPVVLDDFDGLHGDRAAIGLLQALAQTEPTKTLSWHTRAAAQGRD